MFTYIAPILPSDAERPRSEDEFADFALNNVPLCAGVYPLDTVEWLATRVVGCARALARDPAECGIGIVGAPLHADFARWLAQASHEALLDAGAAWAFNDFWESVQINPMDLAGALLEMGAACAYAHQTGATAWAFWVASEDRTCGPGAPPN